MRRWRSRYGSTVASGPATGSWRCSARRSRWRTTLFGAVWPPWAIQEEATRLAVDVGERDGIDLRLRVGLNSGGVIAGGIGSGPFGYAAMGEQVGMAQRMESVAPPGGVMLGARRRDWLSGAASLGELEWVRIKGAEEPVPARRLLGMADGHRAVGRAESNLVGRRWEMAAVEGLLDRAIDGHGAVVGVVGSPGIGKSRLVREVTAMAAARGVEVFTAFCESHASDIPFHVVARLLRAAFGVRDLDVSAARARVRAGSLMPTPRTCCCWRTCWASPTLRWRWPRSIRMPGGGG